MSLSRIQVVQANSGTNIVGSLTVSGIASTKQNNLLVMGISFAGDSLPTDAIAMPTGWARGPNMTNYSNAQSEIWYYPGNPGGITTVTIGTSDGSTALMAATFVEYFGARTRLPLDIFGHSQDFNNPIVSVTTYDNITGVGDLVNAQVAARHIFLTQSFTTGTGFTKLGTDLVGAGEANCTFQEQSVVNQGSQTSFQTQITSPPGWAAVIAAWFTSSSSSSSSLSSSSSSSSSSSRSSSSSSSSSSSLSSSSSSSSSSSLSSSSSSSSSSSKSSSSSSLSSSSSSFSSSSSSSA